MAVHRRIELLSSDRQSDILAIVLMDHINNYFQYSQKYAYISLCQPRAELSYIKITTKLVRSFVSKTRRDFGFLALSPHSLRPLFTTNKEIVLPYIHTFLNTREGQFLQHLLSTMKGGEIASRKASETIKQYNLYLYIHLIFILHINYIIYFMNCQ